MKQTALVAALAALLCTGCATRLLDFTIMSSKNVDLSRAGTFERAKSRSEGEDMVHWIISIPLGVPNAKEAMDRAIESVPGAVALVDGVITSEFWWFLIYGQQRYVVEGTPLIDPQLAATWDHGNYLVTHLDGDGNVRETRSVSKTEYESIRARLLPASGI